MKYVFTSRKMENCLNESLRFLQWYSTPVYTDVIHIHTVSSLFIPLQDGTPTSKTFEHVTSEIGAEEAEEVGVEHLLRWDVL